MLENLILEKYAVANKKEGNSMKIEIRDDTLILENREYNFENTIGTIIILNNMVLVHLFKKDRYITDMSKQTVNNVYALTTEGDILWNIFDIIKKEHCITRVNINSNNQLIAFSFTGIRFTIDIIKKTIIEKIETK